MNEFVNKRAPIKFYRKMVYGNENLYFLSEDDQRWWRAMTDRKTFVEQDMEYMHLMFDVSFEEVLAPKK